MSEDVKAIERYSKALLLQPDDKNCLASRSACYLKVGDVESALRDAEASLKDDKDFYRGLLCKGEALFAVGDFESALVCYTRGKKLRPNLQEFELGVQKTKQAMENDLGRASSVKTEVFDRDDESQKKNKNKQKRRGPQKYQTQPAARRHYLRGDTAAPKWNNKTSEYASVLKDDSWGETRPSSSYRYNKSIPFESKWLKERASLIEQKLQLAGKLNSASQRIQYLEKQMSAAAKELLVTKDGNKAEPLMGRAEFLEKQMRQAANELYIRNKEERTPVPHPVDKQRSKELRFAAYAGRYIKSRRQHPPPSTTGSFDKTPDHHASKSSLVQDLDHGTTWENVVQDPSLGEPPWHEDEALVSHRRNAPPVPQPIGDFRKATAVKGSNAWNVEREGLISQRQVMAKRLFNAQQRIKFLEGKLKMSGVEAKKEMAEVDDMSNQLLYSQLSCARNTLRSKQINWGNEQSALEEHFRKEMLALEASWDRERKDILAENQALFKEKRDYTRKLRFAEQAVKDMEQQIHGAEHRLHERRDALLINLSELERKFHQIESMNQRSRADMVVKQGEVLQQLFLTKLTIQNISMGPP